MDPFQLPAHLEKFAAPNLAAAAKMMTAKGLAPLQPKDMVTAVVAMALDPDEAVAKAAITTLASLPENIAKTAVDGGLAAPVLDKLARHIKHQTIVEQIALHQATHDDTLCHLAENGSTRVVDIISNNQTRLLKNPKLLDALGKNSQTSQAVIDRVFSFLEREGVISIQPTADAASQKEVSVEEFVASLDDFDLPEDFEFPAELSEDLKEEMSEDNVRSLYGKILSMGVVQKIKLAIKGNKEARSILVRDPNKLVSAAVIASPKITENEVIAICSSKTVSDQVLRKINAKKEWRRLYLVQLNLAQNPRTPFDVALGMLKLLRPTDLAGLSKSKSVPNAVATAAKRMIDQKQSK